MERLSHEKLLLEMELGNLRADLSRAKHDSLFLSGTVKEMVTSQGKIGACACVCVHGCVRERVWLCVRCVCTRWCACVVFVHVCAWRVDQHVYVHGGVSVCAWRADEHELTWPPIRPLLVCGPAAVHAFVNQCPLLSLLCVCVPA